MVKKSRQPEGCSKFRVNNNKNNARAPGAIALKPPDPNKTISLNTGIKIITPNPKYKLNKDLLVLLTSSTTSRRPKNRVGKPPRPPNSFFIFMRDKIDNPEYGKQLKERVKIIAELWKDAPKEEKEVFEYYASVAKEINADLYKRDQLFSPRKDEPDDINPTPPDTSSISATSSLSPFEQEPPYRDDYYYYSDGLDDHRDETLDFELYYQLLGQIESFDLFSNSISSDQLNQTISFNSMNNQLHETFPSDQLDQSEDESPTLFNPGLIIDYQSLVGTYPYEIPLLNYDLCLGIDSGLMVPLVADNEAELTEIYKSQNTDKF